MNDAAERNFGLGRGARSAQIRRDLKATSDNEPGQMSLSSEGFSENTPPMSFLLGHRAPLARLLLAVRQHSRPAAGCFGQNGIIQNIPTDC